MFPPIFNILNELKVWNITLPAVLRIQIRTQDPKNVHMDPDPDPNFNSDPDPKGVQIKKDNL